MDHTNTPIHLIACGIFQPELDRVLEQIRDENRFNCVLKIGYIHAGLHSDLDLLENEMGRALGSASDERIIFLYDSKCHPDLDAILDRYPAAARFSQGNCIPIITGEETEGKNSKTFFLTTGWIQKWKEIFDSITGLDETAVRQSFGFYDRVLFKHTHVCHIPDEAILELFEYTGCPIEIEDVSLDLFKEKVIHAIETVLKPRNA